MNVKQINVHGKDQGGKNMGENWGEQKWVRGEIKRNIK